MENKVRLISGFEILKNNLQKVESQFTFVVLTFSS